MHLQKNKKLITNRRLRLLSVVVKLCKKKPQRVNCHFMKLLHGKHFKRMECQDTKQIFPGEVFGTKLCVYVQ